MGQVKHKKYFTIHEGDVGSEAFHDSYVEGLQQRIAELEEEVERLQAELSQANERYCRAMEYERNAPDGDF